MPLHLQVYLETPPPNAVPCDKPPSHLACAAGERGKDATAKVLLEKSVDKVLALGVLNKRKLSVYHLALLSGASEAAQALSCHFMGLLGDAAIAPILPNKKGVPKDTPLMLAVQGHQDKVVQVCAAPHGAQGGEGGVNGRSLLSEL